MPNYPSLAELMAAYKDNGLADGINAGVAGYQQGRDNAAADQKRKQDFQNKLTELGLLKQKTDNDIRDTDEKVAAGKANRVPAVNTGVDSLKPLGDREVNVSTLNAQTKAGAIPGARSQYIGPALDASGKPTGQGMAYVPSNSGGAGGTQLFDMPVGTAGAGMKNTPNPSASLIADEGAVSNQESQLQQLEAMLKETGGGVVPGLKGVVGSMPFGGNIFGKEKVFNDLKKAVAVSTYRAQTGDTRLSDNDAADRAYPLVPDLSEPPEVQRMKTENLRTIFANRKDTIQQQQATQRNLPGSSISAPTNTNASMNPNGGKKTRTLKSGAVVTEE